MEIENVYLECTCADFEHVLRLEYSPAERDEKGRFRFMWPPELCVTQIVNNYTSFFSRIKATIKYIFKKGTLPISMTFSIEEKDVSKIMELLLKFKKEHNLFEEEMISLYEKENQNICVMGK